MSTLAVYPGSFDPLTNGHVDIISRGARLFDRIIVAILVNAEKAPLFSMDERVEIARAVFRDQPNVEVDTFDGLLVDYVERRHAQVIVRGLRAVSDFEFEFQMALMNQRLNAKIETVFMMPAEQYTLHQLAADQGSLLAGRPRARARARHGRSAAAREAGDTSARSMARLAERTTRIAGSATMAVTATVDDRLRRGRRGHRLRRGRAGLSDARRGEERRARGHRSELHEIHAVGGIAELKRAICDRYRTDYGVEYAESEVIVTAGGKQALYNTALTLFGPGDEVITHAPYWPTLTEQIKLADATPVLVRTHAEDGFAIRARADPRRRHAAHARHHHQLAVQSDRRAHLGGRARDDRRRRRAAGHLDRPRSLLREADLRRRAAQPARRCSRSAAAT